nr:MAG TPA: hypothetical protein [Caudoviricetes sp.]
MTSIINKYIKSPFPAFKAHFNYQYLPVDFSLCFT